MKDSLVEFFSLTHAAARAKGVVFVSVVVDEYAERNIDHALLFAWLNDDWAKPLDECEMKWSVAGLCVASIPKIQGIFVGTWGEIACVGGGDTHMETLEKAKGGTPSKRGPMLSIASISGRAYAVGMGRQVYRRDGRDQWTAIDEQIRPAKGDTKPYGFDTIAGFSETDIYAAGRYGEVFHYNGKTWTKLPVPTDQIITHACCAGDGNVYLCGRNGLLLKGRGEEWKVIAHGKRDDLWNLAWFNDRLYVATMKAVFWLSEEADGDYLNDVEWTNGDKPKTCLRLSAADGVLWSIGAKDVLSFDGTTWTRIDGKVAE